jgi:hypothetical protein
MKKQLLTVRKCIKPMDSRKIYHFVTITVLAWFGIWLILQAIILSNSSLYNPDIFIVNEKTNNVYYTAYPFAKFINSCGIPLICGIAWILVGSIPAWQLEKYYNSNPAIYTWLRLPVKRWILYIVKLIPGTVYSIGIWIIQIMLLWVNYLTYCGLTRTYHKASGQWSQFVNHKYIRSVIPVEQPIFFIPLIFLSVLLPALIFLIMLLIHSKEKRVLTLCGLVFGFVAGYSYLCFNIWSVLLIPVATITVMYRSVYILNKVTIC